MDIYKYFGKGGYRKFIKECGHEKYDDVINKTSVLNNGTVNNKKFTARLLFYYKYNSDLELISEKNEIFNFNGNDFHKKKSNTTYYNKLNDKLDTIIPYSINNTKKILLEENNYKNYLGKSKNRTLIFDDIRLYKSIYKYTKEFDLYNHNYNKLSHRILYLIGDLKINCSCGKQNTWSFMKNKLTVVCASCNPKFPEKSWFIKKYGEKGIKNYDEYFAYIKTLKTNSFEWYLKKYGNDEGKILYEKRYERQLKKMGELKNNRYSKISQELFFSIKNLSKLNGKDMYFQENNGEYFINIPKKYNHDKMIMFIDFKYHNKIIEYNGLYWHNSVSDKKRYNILNKMGYDIMIINSNEYNRNKKNNDIIEKCINFIKNAKK